MPIPALPPVLSKLQSLYGAPALPVSDPFRLMVAESCAYLVDDDRRQAVMARIECRFGLEPRALLSAPEEALAEALADGGMHPLRRADKVRQCAALAVEIGPAQLTAEAMQADPDAAGKRLRRFPGIGQPGADKILLFCRAKRTLAPESNGLRALERLGFFRPHKDYAQCYRAAVAAVADALPRDYDRLIRGHLLLRQHGQTLCRRSAPQCELCPLSSGCASYAGSGRGCP
jgi:endonuclease III